MTIPPRVLLASQVELLRWQARWRLGVAVVIGIVLGAAQVRGWLPGDPRQLGLLFVAYAALVVACAFLPSVDATRRSSDGVAFPAYVTIMTDVVALITLTAVASAPGDHDWLLVVGFFFVHLAAYSFGRSAAVAALVTIVAGHLLLAAARVDATTAEWVDELVTVAAFITVAVTFLAQYASRRRRLRGIITLFERAEDGDFSEAYDVAADRRPDAVTLVGGAYNRIRARLESLVLTDSLTGCLNRRGFEQALPRELARADRATTEVALLAIDIDRFKALNDTFGHIAGDEALQQLGKLLLATVRSGDVVARIGGDEFVVLCPDTATEGAEQLGTRLCELVAAHEFAGHGGRMRMTLSVGIAAIVGGAHDHIASELKLRADRALYDAKRAGRNRVETFNCSVAV